ncbi:MAG: hypothetical protein JWO41_718 [Candidatus Saccharibacteria bacterium]|nr:hypothetical protein [Candidatus Saccharibacteria bacterium]
MSQIQSFELTPEVDLIKYLRHVDGLYQNKLDELRALSRLKDTLCEAIGVQALQAVHIEQETIGPVRLTVAA